MSHRTGGLFRSLEFPAVYLFLQNILGGVSARKRFVDEYVRPFSGARVLDAGCGTGLLLVYLPQGVDYIGFDLNPAYIDHARRRHGTRGRFICARAGEPRDRDGQSLDDSDGDFDLVVALALLHHLDDDAAAGLLRDAAGVLRPGGAFVSIDAVFHPGQGFVSCALARADRGASVRTPEAYRRLIGQHFNDVEDRVLTDMLRVPYSHYVARASRPRLYSDR
jgi:SAM-dependent methyltransferase